MEKLILVLCSGNTCRSPMAAELIRMKVTASHLADQVAVESRGIWATDGDAASAHAVALFAEMGQSLADHRSQRLRLADLARADLILVMTEAHLQAVVEMDPKQRNKIVRLSEWSAVSTGGALQGEDIVDPYGQSREVYHATLLELKSVIDQGWESFVAMR